MESAMGQPWGTPAQRSPPTQPREKNPLPARPAPPPTALSPGGCSFTGHVK